MAVTAKITKTCPASGSVYLVPGFLKVRTPLPGKELFSGGGDEIIVDIMPTNVQEASFVDPIAKLHLVAPAGPSSKFRIRTFPTDASGVTRWLATRPRFKNSSSASKITSTAARTR